MLGHESRNKILPLHVLHMYFKAHKDVFRIKTTFIVKRGKTLTLKAHTFTDDLFLYLKNPGLFPTQKESRS